MSFHLILLYFVRPVNFMRNLIWPQKLINFLKRFIRKREIQKTLQDSKRPKGLRLFDFFHNVIFFQII